MSATSNPLIKLVLDSKALSIWNRTPGSIYWWTSNLPAPFYLRTEVMIGRECADTILEQINTIIAQSSDAKTRAGQLDSMMMGVYKDNADYQTVIKAMVEKAKAEFAAGSYTAISGGERRDWIFSIPFAKEAGLKHIYLFKDKSLYCSEALQKDEKTLHVSDIISKAASYFNLWLPALKQSNLICAGTVSVNAHGMAGVNRLVEAGCKTVPLNIIDFSFFQKSFDGGMISKDTLDEIALYYSDDKAWADRYLTGDTKLFDVKNLDKKTFERLQAFFTQDPWGLGVKHKSFMDQMRAEISAKQAA